MENNQNQTKKFLPQQCNPKSEETLVISKNIILGNANLPFLEKDLTLTSCLEYPNLKSVYKGESGKIGYSAITVLVTRFSESFGFSTKMTDSQIEMLTIDTLEHFAYESLLDVILFFKMGRSGKFGATHRGVDSNLIFGDWFPKYLEMKSEERERKVEKDKKSISESTLTVEDVKKEYAKQKNDYQSKYDKVVAYVDKITTDITREKLEEFVVEWLSDPEKKEYIDILKRKRKIIK
jgi:hypothetical protein